MILDVPYIKQKRHNDCGQVSAHMITSYFNGFTTDSYDLICEMSSYKSDSDYTFSINLAIALKKLGHNVDLFTNPQKASSGLEFYHGKSYDTSLEKEFVDLGGQIKETSLVLEEILNKFSKTTVPLVLLNIKRIRNKNGFYGHFVPIVGYDDDFLYVHNPSDIGSSFFQIDRKTFDKARKDVGTDEDIIFVSKQN